MCVDAIKEKSTEVSRFKIKIFLFRSVVIVAVLLALGILIISCASREERAQSFGTPLTVLCSRFVEKQISDSVKLNKPPKFLILDDAGKALDIWHDQLPGEWQAENSGEVDFVLCVRRANAKVEECLYGGLGLKSVSRMRHDALVKIVDVKNKKVVRQITIEGPVPKPCPSNVRSDSASVIHGDDPVFLDLQQKLEKFFGIAAP